MPAPVLLKQAPSRNDKVSLRRAYREGLVSTVRMNETRTGLWTALSSLSICEAGFPLAPRTGAARNVEQRPAVTGPAPAPPA